MSNTEESLQTFSIGELFNSDQYVIPIYQRNFAWGESQINQLIRDIYDFSKGRQNLGRDYFLGTLVVFERKENNHILFETIDGQQRLTTLNIMLSVLHREFESNVQKTFSLNLRFDSREKSTETIKLISNFDKDLVYQKDKEYQPEMQQAYEICLKNFKNLFKTEQDIKYFYSYLSESVKILRVSVPDDTNLNHYFEVMNTRGEQLEKHEVLKARLMSKLKTDNDKYIFNRIWKATSDMERYVQYGFTPNERDDIFGKKSWDRFQIDSFADLLNKIGSDDNEVDINNKKQKPTSIQGIVKYDGSFESENDTKEDIPERFYSIINFQNFLLHVLRVQQKEDISLDDKQLLIQFDKYLKDDEEYIPESEVEEFVKQFGYNLLKLKYIFDKFIIKREFVNDKEGWSLKRLKWYEKNRVSYVNTFSSDSQEKDLFFNADIIMLLSMFHVSAPTQIYKHWLNASLLYCFDNFNEINDKNCSGKGYKDYLTSLSKTYMLDKYLANEEKEFYDIIYKNHCKPINSTNNGDIDLRKLDSGTQVENFVFNYLDYLLWKTRNADSKFEFSFRSSVEHYYPQNPNSESNKIDKKICDLFGNLCLISRSKNSKLSNYMPTAKKEHYLKVEPDSLKQERMMKIEGKNWTIDQIKEETEQMKEKILYSLKNY